ncbi:MAG: GvpL/GvpF family gas vesicle protein [Anaerocolumna sp.]
MGKNNYYIYGITFYVPEDGLTVITGHHKEPVFQLEYKELTAHVSRTALTYFETSLENLECHEDVISHLMKDYDVLPMSFSTICKSEEKVIGMLEKYYDQFISNLKNVEGKFELGIKVFYKLDFEEEDKKDKEILKSPKEYMMKRYERYQNRQKQVDQILSAIEEYHGILADMAAKSQYTKPLKNNLIFNASYLVGKNQKEKFNEVVKEMKEKNPAYKILYSGPWPAYHFVNIVREGEEDE